MMQSIKLFDRKFVANTVRNYHRCPKCRSEYSFWYDVPDKYSKDVVVKSNRPMLLPCGHNMCENCVYHNRQNLMCKICLKPVELSIHQLGQGQHFHVRDHFDMNFFLLGELNNIRYYRKDCSANSTLLATTQNSASSNNNTVVGSSAIAPSTIKCIECELVPAIGKCRQCKVYMCKRCFDVVHKGSKVLKMHTLQRLDKETKTTNFERLLKPRFCRRHQRRNDSFCQKCNFFCCPECARMDHQYHGFQSLLELNKKHIDGVINTLENVKASRDNVRKSLKVSHNSK